MQKAPTSFRSVVQSFRILSRGNRRVEILQDDNQTNFWHTANVTDNLKPNFMSQLWFNFYLHQNLSFWRQQSQHYADEARGWLRANLFKHSYLKNTRNNYCVGFTTDSCYNMNSQKNEKFRSWIFYLALIYTENLQCPVLRCFLVSWTMESSEVLKVKILDHHGGMTKE
jgi:hypothetical protein